MTRTFNEPMKGRPYEIVASELEQYGRLLCDLIERLLATDNLNYHSIGYRVKTLQSASKKVASKPDRYRQIHDLKDLLGLRIITYFNDDVDRIAHVLTDEFQVDTGNSTDKRAAQDPDRFGYASLHYVLSLNQTRGTMREYTRFAEHQFEIQIRSILQHAWAEIEHDLGYKTKGAIPREVRRRFSRLAGLLELADDEFQALRTELEEYKESVSEVTGQELRDLELNQSTLDAYILQSPVCRTLDTYIAHAFGGHTLLETTGGMSGVMVERLQKLGVSTVAQIDDKLQRNATEIASLAKEWIKSPQVAQEADPSTETFRGICIFYLWLFLLVSTPEQRRRDILNKVWIGEGQSMSRDLLASWRRAQSSKVDLSRFESKP